MTTISENSARAEPMTMRRGRISSRIDIWRRRLLIGVVMTYAGILILAPIAGLLSGAFSEGVYGIISALSQPDVFSAFGLTLYIALITVIVHAIFGTILAWVL